MTIELDFWIIKTDAVSSGSHLVFIWQAQPGKSTRSTEGTAIRGRE